jgi:protein subunit release factor A
MSDYKNLYEELCYENDEINRKWAEDNERNGDILSAQQEQIERLELQNKTLKSQLQDLSEITTLIREARDADVAEEREEIKFLKEHIEILEKQLDRRD